MAFLGVEAMEGLEGESALTSRFTTSSIFNSNTMSNMFNIMSSVSHDAYTMLTSTEGLAVSAITGLITIISLLKKKS